MNITYIARNTLYPGHTAGVQYSFDIDIAQDGLNIGTRGKSHTSISLDRRNNQTVYHGFDKIADVTTVPIRHDSEKIGLMREFLDSCVDGQYITVDLMGTAANPVGSFSAILETLDYKEQQVGGLHFKFSFTLRLTYGATL